LQIYHPSSEKSGGYGRYSCDECETRLSEDLCLNDGCEWITDDEINNGICISSFSSSPGNIRNFTCEMLRKEQCNKFINARESKSVIIINGPCFFNGVVDDDDDDSNNDNNDNNDNNNNDNDSNDNNDNTYSDNSNDINDNSGNISKNDSVCVKKLSIESKDCKSIKTNSIVMYDGEERESCNEAHLIFGYSSVCGWANKYNKNRGSCGYIYYLVENSFFFIFFLFFFNFFFNYNYDYIIYFGYVVL
jgi:hypothetical protein